MGVLGLKRRVRHVHGRLCCLPLLIFASALLAFILLSPTSFPCTPKPSTTVSFSPTLPPHEAVDAAQILSRQDFPRNFIFGTASSAFQYEGAAGVDGRGPSIWDTFSRKEGNILDGANADVSCDQYHLYKEDITLMTNMGVDAYRFSISWPRLFPEGRGRLNKLGVAYYDNLINALVEAGIAPYVTLYHWDLPQALHDAYGGWLSSSVIDDFAVYADTCFKLFGDRVKHWITFNEPNIFIQMGYDLGNFAPRRCSSWIKDCNAGNSATEPYIAAHNVLLSHAAVVDIYRKQYQMKQHGSIGISISVNWYIPLRDTDEDANAVQRIFAFQLGWFLDPLTEGNYPAVMHELVGERLPSFTEEQKNNLKHSCDFIGINHYTTTYTAAINLTWDSNHTDYFRDSLTSLSSERDGTPIGPRAASEWLYIIPSGIYHVVKYVKDKYNLPIFITENGMDDADNGSLPLNHALQDLKRVQFHADYLYYLAAAIREGVDVWGYFAWSLLDNFEWVSGYTLRFGLHFVDYTTSKRYPKASARWFKDFLARNSTQSTHSKWWPLSCASSR
ncbi:hypothetical protein GOP47_0002158 [Adiantum capillus-veneris]|uniref:Beta-glucosidase n=1 Tax=Adiantum capillus-veneris TaxID=13818 RepID=A0A9D4V9A1_ADICA|nr:hypothetical protein GOP47_0001319 [Adiantum capillus-veneris]KAI5082415.1 hypothetical protein GOP47_0002158 [Adiantum capillus-veneris]